MGKAYSKSRAAQQTVSVALKSKKIAAGTKIVLKDLVTGSRKTPQGAEVANDMFMCTTENGNIRVPVSELLRMKTNDGKDIFRTEDGQESGEFPEALTIASSEDRKDRNGNVIYPIGAYILGEEFLREGSKLDWAALVAGGLKPDNKFDAVQNYVVSI